MEEGLPEINQDPTPKATAEKEKRRPCIGDVFGSGLQPSARLVYAAMCFYAASTRRFWLAIPVLAKHCGLSQSGARKAVRELEKEGYIQRVFSSRGGSRKNKDGKLTGICSEYVLRRQKTDHQEATRHSVAGSEIVPDTECASTQHSGGNYPLVSGDRGQHHDDRKTTAAHDHPDAVAFFDAVEIRLGRITKKTRAELQRTVEEQGFTIDQLAQAFRRYGAGYKTVGGLITFARALSEHAPSIDDCEPTSIPTANAIRTWASGLDDPWTRVDCRRHLFAVCNDTAAPAEMRHLAAAHLGLPLDSVSDVA
jgi:hypothetical protein